MLSVLFGETNSRRMPFCIQDERQETLNTNVRSWEFVSSGGRKSSRLFHCRCKRKMPTSAKPECATITFYSSRSDGAATDRLIHYTSLARSRLSIHMAFPVARENGIGGSDEIGWNRSRPHEAFERRRVWRIFNRMFNSLCARFLLSDGQT